MLLDPAAERAAELSTGIRGGILREMPAAAVPVRPARSTAALARLEEAAQAELLHLRGTLPSAEAPVDSLLCEVCWDLGVDGMRAMELGRHATPPRT